MDQFYETVLCFPSLIYNYHSLGHKCIDYEGLHIFGHMGLDDDYSWSTYSSQLHEESIGVFKFSL